MPGSYDDDDGGVLISDTTPNSPAEAGGVEADDRIVKWNGEDVADIRAWMGMLAKHEPGDEVDVTVLRGGEEVVLKVTLKGRDTGDEEKDEEKDEEEKKDEEDG